MQQTPTQDRSVIEPRASLTAESKRELVILLSRSVAHLYALAGACARPDALPPDQRGIAIAEVAEMLMEAYRHLHDVPECAVSVLEQCAFVTSVERAPLDGADIAMVLARSGLVINTWCTAATLLAKATDGPVTIGGLVALVSAMQPDARHQAAVIERLTATAYDSSAIRELGTCYMHALEGYSLLELHKLIGVQDMARLRAADLLDSASRGAVIAVHFLARTSMHECQAAQDDADEGAEGEQDQADGTHEGDRGATGTEPQDGPAMADDRALRDAVSAPEPDYAAHAPDQP